MTSSLPSPAASEPRSTSDTFPTRHLQEEGLLDHAAAEEIDQAAQAEAMEAVRFSDAGPPPGIEDIVTDVYWESDHDTPASRIGRHFFGG